MFGRGKLIPEKVKLEIVKLIEEANKKGPTIRACCKIIGISANTYRSWLKSCEDKRTTTNKTNPKNKLREEEIEEIRDILYSEEFADKSPHKIVPLLANEGIYKCSESTMYRILRKDKATKRRTQNRKEDQVRVRPNLVAVKPNEIYNWDVTYIPSKVAGIYFRMLVIIDMYSRKIIGFKMMHIDTLEMNQKFLEEIIAKYGNNEIKFVHGDNGRTVKGATLSETLRRLGVINTHSRPHVSNDNPYIESFFGTTKTMIEYPKDGFNTIEEVEEWMTKFVKYYNNELHSGIGYVTPNERFEGKDRKILAKRKEVYKRAYKDHPERFPRGIKKFNYQEVVTLNPMKEEEIQEYLKNKKESKVV